MRAMHKTRRISQRLRRLLATIAPDQQRASLQGLEVENSDFGAWLEAGGERRKAPRPDRPRR